MSNIFICDKCEHRIIDYSSDFNKLKFRRFVIGEGSVLIEADLCDECMNKIAEFIKNLSVDIVNYADKSQK